MEVVLHPTALLPELKLQVPRMLLVGNTANTERLASVSKALNCLAC